MAEQETFLEDMPMRRYTNPLPTCEEKKPPSLCHCREELEQITALLICQNQILTDLLGAVNGLTAALLARQ